MLLKYFYDKSLAHASYLVGCQKSGEAIVIDPSRDITPYLEAAKAEALRIVGVRRNPHSCGLRVGVTGIGRSGRSEALFVGRRTERLEVWVRQPLRLAAPQRWR